MKPLRLASWIVPLAILALIAWGLADTLAIGRPASGDGSRTIAPGFPRTLALVDGTELTLEAPPRRIIPASSGLADLVCALAPPERIAAVPAQVRDYSGLREPGNAYLGRPQFEVYAAEPILAYQPDLVVTDRWQVAETTARLREAGVPVLVMDAPENLEEVRSALTFLSRALGTEEAGLATLEGLFERVQALATSTPRRAGLRALAYSNGGTGGWVAGAGTAADEWLTLAGLANAAADAGRVGHERCSFEELIAIDPDVIVVAGTPGVRSATGTAAVLRGEPMLASLVAVRQGAIVQLEPWLYDTVSQHIVTAAERLAAAVDALLAERP